MLEFVAGALALLHHQLLQGLWSSQGTLMTLCCQQHALLQQPLLQAETHSSTSKKGNLLLQ